MSVQRADELSYLFFGWSANVILNKSMPRDVDPVAMIFWSAAGAIPVPGALMLLIEPQAAWNLSAAAASVLYLGVLAAGVGFVLIVWLTCTYSASRVNVFVFLSPVFGVLIGWAVLDEPITALQAMGALGVAAGILVVTAEACA